MCGNTSKMSSHHKKEHIPKHVFVYNHDVEARINPYPGFEKVVSWIAIPLHRFDVMSWPSLNVLYCNILWTSAKLHSCLEIKTEKKTHNLVEMQLQILDGLSKEVTALHCESLCLGHTSSQITTQAQGETQCMVRTVVYCSRLG
ncbi:hypothetical protein AALO_G00299630 [Alosa alosa]|uniref:Uncharacterized protein n=1 Tax=Alosa alosa TaxID=278164 RepID=A0AAV6FEG2_9TELE|nr:hypothetical protein AALO_G00299630 [Alosa alosa]